ncbi:MAG TPA: glycosyltransferase [Puia sp.]|nr:glycosyltransferase [Puia sp.]
MPKKIVILTTGQPSTNPRMVKEVEALREAGETIIVFYSYWAAWALPADEELLARHPGVFRMVGGSPGKDRLSWLLTRLFYKMAFRLGGRVPFFRQYALARTTRSLEKAALRERADLFIAHNLGSLPAAVKAARKWGAAVGFDAEDYHRGEFERPEGPRYRYTAYVEETFMPACDYLTAASPLIAEAYEKILGGKRLTVVNNVFSRDYLQPERRSTGRGLRLFWFSQTVGPDRGLELIVRAIALLPEYEIRFDIAGACSDAYKALLTGFTNGKDYLEFIPPVSPDRLFPLSAGYDIGMAAEVPHSENRDRCLTNKLFTYLLAGNGILASSTSAQRRFMEENPGIGYVYDAADARDLAACLSRLYTDRALLEDCRRRSRALGADRYNWETEKLVFLEQIAPSLKKNEKDPDHRPAVSAQ